MDGIDDIIDCLSGLGDIPARAMFGGHGLYCRDVIFAVAHEGHLYLKVDEGSKGDYLARPAHIKRAVGKGLG